MKKKFKSTALKTLSYVFIIFTVLGSLLGMRLGIDGTLVMLIIVMSFHNAALLYAITAELDEMNENKK